MHRVVETDHDRTMLLRLLQERSMPFTIEVVNGRRRSVAQNALQRLWMNEIAEQTGQTAEEVRGFCKLTMGVPILRAESELFRIKYDKIVKPHSYEDKLAFMMEPLDMPVTRLMTTGQKTRYLDAIYQHFTEKGYILTLPDPQHDDMQGHNGAPPLDDTTPRSDATSSASENPAVSEPADQPSTAMETAGASLPDSGMPAVHHPAAHPEPAAGVPEHRSTVPSDDVRAPAAVPPLSAKDKALLRKYAGHLADAIYERDLRKGSGLFLSDHHIVEDMPVYTAARKIFEAHLARVKGTGSLLECDQVEKEIAA